MTPEDSLLPERMSVHAKDGAQVNAVQKIENVRNVYVGNKYQNPCQLAPPVVEHINDVPNNRDLAAWTDRARIQAELLRRVEDADTLLIELVAAGGFGKSSMAVWVSEQVESEDRQVIWVELSQASRFSAFARWVLYELCILTDDTMSEEFLIGRIVRNLRKKDCLLVIDQMEAIAQTAEKPFFERFLAEWQKKQRISTVLVTTRQRFLPQDELCLRLSGFTPDEGSAFLQKKKVSTALSDGLESLSEVCKGHPLLLNLSATWLAETKENALNADGLDFFEKLFTDNSDSLEPRVEGILKRLLGELSTTLRAALLETSVYQIPFDLGMAQAMQAEITEAELDGIEAQGFLLGQESRWRLHPLVSQFVVEKRQERETEIEINRKAIAYFEAQLQAETTDLQNYLECFHHHCECQDYKAAFDVINRCDTWLDLNGYYRILVDTYERLATAWQVSPPDDRNDQEKLAEAFNRLGNGYYSLGDYAKAIDFHQQSLVIQREIGNQQGIAASLVNLGNGYYSLGDYAKVIDFQQQSLVIQREIGNQQGIAASLVNLGNAYDSLGDYAKAIDFFQQSLKIQREIGDRKGVASSLGNLGSAYHSLGDYTKAIDFQQQSLKIQREIGNRKGIASSLGNLGSAYDSLGDYAKAIDFHQQSLVIQREIGNQQGIAASLGNLGNAYGSLGDYAKAIDLQQQSLVIEREIGDRNGEAISLLNLGHTYAKIDEHWKSRNSYEQAKAIFTDLQLAHEVKDCEKAIQERNRIISLTPKKAPALPTQNTEPDWREKSMPVATPTRSTSASPKRQSSLPKWLPYLAVAAAVLLLVLLLQ